MTTPFDPHLLQQRLSNRPRRRHRRARGRRNARRNAAAGGGPGAAEAPLRLRRGARASKAKAKRDGKVARMAILNQGGEKVVVVLWKSFQNIQRGGGAGGFLGSCFLCGSNFWSRKWCWVRYTVDVVHDLRLQWQPPMTIKHHTLKWT